MNKRLAIIGLTMLIFPVGASAAVDCHTLLDNPTPVTPYTASVLARVESAFGYIRSLESGGGSSDEQRLVDIFQWAGATIASTVDSYLQVVEATQNLTHRSTCEEYDIVLLECTMERIREDMNTAAGDGRFGSAYRLQELHSFVNIRLRNLLVGARDPRVEDATWGESYSFDPPAQVWCCLAEGETEDEEGGICRQRTEEECAEQGVPFSTLASCTDFGCAPPQNPPDDTGMLCPFSSDYFPPSSDGFGCDISIVKDLQGFDGATRDYGQLEKLMEKIRAFRTQAKGLLGLQERIAALLDGSSPLAPQPPAEDAADDDPKHRAFEGCPIGQCSDDPEKSCTKNTDCGPTAFCRKGWKRCENHDEDFCDNDSDCEENGGGACVLMDPPDNFSAWELRGSFSAVRDETKLLSVFRDLRGRETREFSDELKIPEEQKPGKTYVQLDLPTERMMRGVARTEVSAAVQAIGRAEADLFARGADPIYRVAEIFQPLRDAGKPLAEVASRQDGLRQLVVRFAWFLRRTCLDRPCSARLETVMRLAQAESCFPYTSGQYLSQSCESPLWKQCLEDAKLLDQFTLPDLDCDE